MRNIYIMSGIPGSGKSTYISKYAAPGDIILSRDNFRAELRAANNTDDYFPIPTKEEYRQWVGLIQKTLTDNPQNNIWIDQTTLTQKSADKLLRTLMPFLTNNDFVCFIVIHTTLQQCLERNAARLGKEIVPEGIVYNMHKSRYRDPIHLAALLHNYPGHLFQICHTNEMEAL